MQFEIKSRWNSTVLFTCEAASLLLAVEAAVKSHANLHGAYLRGAYLHGAYLRGAYLRDADLRGADLRDADLRDADLRDANLGGAYLRDADLRDADLRDADLRDANLGGANLGGANLRDAYLGGANLGGAYLGGANLKDAKNSEMAQAQTVIVPEGNLIGWKKCCNGVIVKLLIPQKAKRSNATGRKCRAEYAQVLRVLDANGKPASEGISTYNSSIIYRKGETVHCDKWNEDRFVECGDGIHFFITKVEAENYV